MTTLANSIVSGVPPMFQQPSRPCRQVLQRATERPRTIGGAVARASALADVQRMHLAGRAVSAHGDLGADLDDLVVVDPLKRPRGGQELTADDHPAQRVLEAVRLVAPHRVLDPHGDQEVELRRERIGESEAPAQRRLLILQRLLLPAQLGRLLLPLLTLRLRRRERPGAPAAVAAPIP